MRNVLAILFAAGTILGPQATLAQELWGPIGSTARLIMHDGARLSGELLAAQRDSTWVLHAGVIHAVPLNNVVQVQLRGRGMDSRGILLWTLIGGAVTGAALTGACSSVSHYCGGVFGATIGAWGLVGGIAAAITKSPHRFVNPHSEVLAPYARFPQGLPPQFRP